MEYERKKKQILETVDFALVENKLERNFKSIVQALLLTQSEAAQLKEDLLFLANSTSKEISNLNLKISELEKRNQSVRDASKPSIHCSEGSPNEEQPKININLVESPNNTEENISPTSQAPNQSLLTQQYEELKAKVDQLMGDRVDPSEIDRKLSGMRDTINLLRAELKVLSDREAKSARRVSIGAADLTNVLQKSGPPSNHDLKAINEFQQEFDREINNFHIEINTLKLCMEQMKESLVEVKRKEAKTSVQLDQLKKDHKKLEQRVQSTNDAFQGQIKAIKADILSLQNRTDSQSNKKPRVPTEMKQNVSPNANNQINDKLSKLQSMIQACVSQAQFKRFKTEVKDKISGLESQDQNIKKELKDQIQMITDILDAKEEQIAAINKEIEEIKSKLNDIGSHCERKNNISISRCEELKKSLQNLREDLEFYKTMSQPSQGRVILKLGEENNVDDSKPSKNEESGGKSNQELKKYVNRKLHDQRTYLLGLIRDLEKKSGGSGKSNLEQDLSNMWDKLGEINLFLNKKANEDDVKKSLNYFEKKLGSLYQKMVTSNDNNEDARIAKTNWFCLSCDKNLQNYQGKVGQHMVWDSMPIKAGYTKYYNKEDKKSLPTLKR